MGSEFDELCAICDLSPVGLDPARIERIDLIHRKHGDRLYRVRCRERWYVLKWFHDPPRAVEVRSYALLQRLGVPTLPLHGRTVDALLLEDLAYSPAWRLAEEPDVQCPETGAAVANWYRVFHAAGRELFIDPAAPPAFLGREADALNADAVREIGEKLNLAHDPVWMLAQDLIEPIKEAMRSLPETLNYNDFHWTNLALSRHTVPQLDAIVFDYHLLGIGLRYSDCSNVVGSLGERAAAAFWETYGPVDEQERILDEPTAALYALLVAVRMPRFPGWARGCLRMVENGDLERGLRRVSEII
jgi:hypothetical protein